MITSGTKSQAMLGRYLTVLVCLACAYEAKDAQYRRVGEIWAPAGFDAVFFAPYRQYLNYRWN